MQTVKPFSYNILYLGGNPALRLFGFGPVVSDGFGIGYIIKEEGLQVDIFFFSQFNV